MLSKEARKSFCHTQLHEYELQRIESLFLEYKLKQAQNLGVTQATKAEVEVQRH